jgi:UDP-GlcNAc:undecaprenyl-phosphate GlcNAc-1-phosphate transferase
LDHPQSNKLHERTTPYLGGVAVAAGLLAVGVLAGGASGQISVVLLAALAMTALGVIDDWRTVGPGVKIVVEVGAALALWASGVGAGLFGSPVLDATLTVLWVVTVVNAVNLVDNMDGLASGLAAISALGFFAIAAGEGYFLVASLAAATAGAALGFLRHNFPPASIFLGDAGSLLLGFLLAALGLKLDLIGQNGFVRSLIPMLLLAVPLFDMILVIVARLADGRPVYIGGTDHSSHRLLRRGLEPRTVALAAYAVQTICVIAALALNRSAWPVVVVAAITSALVALVALASLLRAEPLVMLDEPAGETATP